MPQNVFIYESEILLPDLLCYPLFLKVTQHSKVVLHSLVKIDDNSPDEEG